MLNILPKFELVPISRYFITITEPISLYPGDSVEYDGDFHLILKNNNQGLTAIQELLTTLVQETREYKARVMLDKDFRVIVEEAVSAAIKTTPLVQLTPQENLQSELPPDLQLWMGRVEGLLVGQQRQIDILTGLVITLILQKSVQIEQIEHPGEHTVEVEQKKFPRPRAKRGARYAKAEQQLEQVVSALYTQPDITVREVAELLSCSVGTAHARLTEAREILWKDRP